MNYPGVKQRSEKVGRVTAYGLSATVSCEFGIWATYCEGDDESLSQEAIDARVDMAIADGAELVRGSAQALANERGFPVTMTLDWLGLDGRQTKVHVKPED